MKVNDRNTSSRGDQLASRRREAIDDRAVTPSREGRQRAHQAYRTYRRWLRLKRMILAAFAITAGFFCLWVIPWLPSGLDTQDYTPELEFTTYLLAGVVLTGLLAVVSHEFVQHKREALLAWSSIYEGATGVRDRAYLFERLSLECERAQLGAGVFSLLVLRINFRDEAPMSLLTDAALQGVAELVESLTRGDAVALLAGSELAVLAVGVDKARRGHLLERLTSAVREELSSYPEQAVTIDVHTGAATYGTDGTEASMLVQAARTAAMRAPATETHAA